MALRIVKLRLALVITMLYPREGLPHQSYLTGANGILIYEDAVLARMAARSIESMHRSDVIVDVEEIECEPEEDDGSC